MRRFLKVFFSRYMISGLLILLEIGFIGYLVFELSSYSIYFFAASLIINIFVLIAVINADCNPEYKVTWMAIVFILPGFGALLYILFRHRKMGKIEAKRAVQLKEDILEGRIRSDDDTVKELCSIDGMACGKVRAVKTSDHLSQLYKNTTSKYYALGEDMYKDMLEDLKNAKKYIFLEYFIISKGEMWDGILEILKEKVKEGLDVRVSYDDLGCMSTLPTKYYAELRKYGINCYCFSKFNPYVSTVHNNRDHRKFLIIDGKIGYTGGINLADEYINTVVRFGHWKDGGVRCEGDAVQGFLFQFLSLWSMNTGEEMKLNELLPPTPCEENDTFEGDGGFYLPYGSGPSPMYENQVGKRVFLDIINQSKNYVYITTPYLIIDFDLTEALRGAAQRGVDVRIITPGIADKKIVKVMTKSSYPYLMEAGVKIFEYTPGFIHEKTLVSDDIYAVVGTVNFDYRSLVHHFEDGLWMYNTPTVSIIKEEYLKTISVSHLMNEKEAKLNFMEWLIRCGIRLFAPLL